ncbi:MAG: hypothetical protein ABUL68_05730 [Pseudomonadota bacterium]
MNPTANIALHLPADQQARLHLAPAQEEQVAPILQDEFEQLDEVRADRAATPSHRDRFFLVCEARWIREESDNRIEQLLTDAQQKIWEEIRDERRAEMRDEFQRHASMPPFHASSTH